MCAVARVSGRTVPRVLTDHAPTQPPPPGAAVRWAGRAGPDLLEAQSSRGRRRRWVYAAAGDEQGSVGAAVVHIGLLGLGTAFAFASGPGGAVTWDAGPGRAGDVGGLAGTATARRAGGTVEITPAHLHIDVPVDGGRLRADLDLAAASPVSLLTPTPQGGWNATTKAAGHAAAGTVRLPGTTWELDGGAWTDATEGRQDPHTTWRWAAGAGRTQSGATRDRRVGLQASTGMNGLGPGEDLVWWDRQPYPLAVETLAPVTAGDFAGAWELAGQGWSLRLDPQGVRAAEEGVGPLRSRYCQPVGTWHGTLPGPDGDAVPVRLAGVAEDHEARW